MRRWIIATLLAGTLAAAGACDDKEQPTATAPTPMPTTPIVTPPSDPEPTSLAVTGPDSLMVGATAQYQATITYSDGAERPGEDVEWESGNTTVATVDAAGVVVGRQAGTFDLTARAMGLSDHKTGLRVDAPTRTGAWRGLTIALENRCSPYDADDYSYPQSVEDDIVRNLGGIYSPYTCETFDSDTQTDIEHIVARSEAHDSGLCGAEARTRREFARDLLNLTLASPSLNRSQKSDKDAAEWMPEQNQCWFAQTIVDVRLKYGLTIDQAEADAIDRMLAGCTSTAISCSNITQPPAADHPPVQAYPNYTAMRDAGWNRGVNRNGGTYRASWGYCQGEASSGSVGR